MDYDACRDALERAEADLDPAELHGTLCAMLCTGRPGSLQQWLAELVVTEVGLGAHARVLESAAQRTRAALVGGEMALELLLPDDHTPLRERGQALADWCKGFLFGIGLAGDALQRHLSADAREVIVDLTELSRLDADEEEDDGSEAAYAELVEYVRVAVLLIHEELGPHDGEAFASNRVH